jgi:hypothetical protein
MPYCSMDVRESVWPPLTQETQMLTKIPGLALLSLVLCAPAQAQIVEKNVEIGSGIFCDTQQQVERFVALFQGDAEAAINSVNAEAKDPTACAAATIAFVRRPEVAIARTWHATFHIVPIVVVGVVTKQGLQITAPAAAFSIERTEERDA